MEYPFISCKCITYGRVNTLVEALHSFLIQDYPADRCELIIVNDYPDQKLVFDHPQVTIYNLDETFPIIGDKENYAIERCKGPLIAVWDDDDIAMPNHLQNIAKWWKEDTNLIHWERAVLFDNKRITSLTSVGNSGIVYSKSAWEQIGKSPIMNAGGDMKLVTSIHKLGRDKVVKARPANNEISWFYMWGGRGYHQSGMGTDKPGRPDIVTRHSKYIKNQKRKGKIATGEIKLVPKWNQPYDALLKEFITKGTRRG